VRGSSKSCYWTNRGRPNHETPGLLSFVQKRLGLTWELIYTCRCWGGELLAFDGSVCNRCRTDCNGSSTDTEHAAVVSKRPG
jgi:hypothetical protein